jgi:hypothetical protein
MASPIDSFQADGRATLGRDCYESNPLC